MWSLVFAVIVFLCGLYVTLNYGTSDLVEPFFVPKCPNVLIQSGNEIWLKNTYKADIPGVNPVVFHNLEEYTQFVAWQQSQGLNCPALMLQKKFDAQNNEVFNMDARSLKDVRMASESSRPMPVDTTMSPYLKPPPVKPLYDSTRDNPPYNLNSYPGMDPANQDIGKNTPLDVYGKVGETRDKSVDAMDPNWGGVNYSKSAVDAGNYIGNEVYKYGTQR